MAASVETRIKITYLQKAVYPLLVCLAASGYRGGVAHRDVPTAPTVCAIVRGNEVATADRLAGENPTPLSGSTAASANAPELPWGTRGLLPFIEPKYQPDPRLLEEAADVMEAPVVQVRPYIVGRSSKKVFHVQVRGMAGGERGWFVERGGRYVRLDSGAELIGINEVLSEYRFTREDFNDPAIARLFLSNLLSLAGVRRGTMGSSYGLARMTSRNGLTSWLRGTEKSEAAIRELCRDPVFVFEGNKWKVRLNIFHPDGSVSQFACVGRHDPQAHSNEILRMDVTTIRPPGTFSYPLGG